MFLCRGLGKSGGIFTGYVGKIIDSKGFPTQMNGILDFYICCVLHDCVWTKILEASDEQVEKHIFLFNGKTPNITHVILLISCSSYIGFSLQVTVSMSPLECLNISRFVRPRGWLKEWISPFIWGIQLEDGLDKVPSGSNTNVGQR